MTTTPSPTAPLPDLVEVEHPQVCPTAGDSGATAVEYALLVALIAAVIVAIVTTLGLNVVTLYDTIKNAFPG